jgi:hypothetical protein
MHLERSACWVVWYAWLCGMRGGLCAVLKIYFLPGKRDMPPKPLDRLRRQEEKRARRLAHDIQQAQQEYRNRPPVPRVAVGSGAAAVPRVRGVAPVRPRVQFVTPDEMKQAGLSVPAHEPGRRAFYRPLPLSVAPPGMDTGIPPEELERRRIAHEEAARRQEREWDELERVKAIRRAQALRDAERAHPPLAVPPLVLPPPARTAPSLEALVALVSRRASKKTQRVASRRPIKSRRRR